MRVLLSLLLMLALLLNGCTGAADNSPEAVDAAVRSALLLLETGLNREDAVLASQAVGTRFSLGENVAARYGASFGEQRGGPALRNFLHAAFLNLANVEQRLTLSSLLVTGAVATAEVEQSFSAMRTDSTPPENIVVSSVDFMVFEYEAGGWRLTTWDELAPAT